MKRKQQSPSLLPRETTKGNAKLKLALAIIAIILSVAVISLVCILLLDENDSEPEKQEAVGGFRISNINVILLEENKINVWFNIEPNFDVDTITFLASEGMVVAVADDGGEPTLLSGTIEFDRLKNCSIAWTFDGSEEQKFVQLKILAENTLVLEENFISLAIKGNQHAFLTQAQYEQFAKQETE